MSLIQASDGKHGLCSSAVHHRAPLIDYSAERLLVSVVVIIVAVSTNQFAADLAAGEPCGVHIDIGITRLNGAQEGREIMQRHCLVIRCARRIQRDDVACRA